MAVAVMLAEVSDAFADEGLDTFITSGIDGVHGRGSLHTDDPERDDKPALDFRTRHAPTRAAKLRIYRRIKKHLSPAFDVVLEFLERPNEHLHVEYDP